MSTTNPHDALFKATFGQPDLARSELELVLPPEVRAYLDLGSLTVCPGSFVDDELRHAHTDLLYALRTTTGHEALVHVVFEHQSTFDAAMPFRLLRYMVSIWTRWLRDHPGSSRLPVVLPVLLHHGKAGWEAAPEFATMLDASPELLEAVRPFQPMFRFILDDLARLSPAALSSRRLHALARLVQLAFWSSRSLPRLREVAPLLTATLATLALDERSHALLAQLFHYILNTSPPDVDLSAVRTILLQVAGPAGREDVMNAAEQLIEQGRVEGRAEGRVEGRVEGRADGAAEGLRTAIATALTARGLFLSEFASARLAACSDLKLLNRWLARAVIAASEAEVFTTTGEE